MYVRHVMRSMRIGLFVLVIFLSVVGLVSAETLQPTIERSSEDQVVSAEHNGKHASWDTYVSEQAASSRAAAATAAPANVCQGSADRDIRYASSSNRIYLSGCDETFTLSEVAADSSISSAQLELVDAANKIWLLKANLLVEEGATLNIIGNASGDAEWVRLLSNSTTGVWLRAENGNLYFQDTKVTSWDDALGTFDTDLSTQGRAYVGIRSRIQDGRATNPPTSCAVNGGTQEYYEGRMDIIDSEMAYLGYPAGESYGVNWKVLAEDASDYPGRTLYDAVDVFGDVTGSNLHHNYFGTFTFGAYCMNFLNNTYANNISYGLDPHDDSDYLTIDNNTFRDNGNHGFICSKYCDHLTITNNTSFGNDGNGIMLHRNVEDSIVDNNNVYDNDDSGIAIFDSNNNTITNNTSTNNRNSAIRLSVGSQGNQSSNNVYTGRSDTSGSGYVLYFYEGSDIATSGDGRPRYNSFVNDTLIGYRSTIVRLNSGFENTFQDLTISALGSSGTTIFDMQAGVDNVVIRPNYASITNLQAHYSTRDDSNANTIVEDQQLNADFTLRHDTTAMTTLRDTRNYIWFSNDNNFTTIVDNSRSVLELDYAETGEYETLKTIDFIVEPSSGGVSVTPLNWNTSAPYNKQWQEAATNSTGIVVHQIGDLAANTCYRIDVNGTLYTTALANPSGYLTFYYNGGYNGVQTFDLYETSSENCSPTAIVMAGAAAQSTAGSATVSFVLALLLLATMTAGAFVSDATMPVKTRR